MLKSGNRSIFAALLLTAGGWSNSALAHIIMVGDLMSRGGDQKMSPCDGAKGDGPVYTFQPGTTITLALSESVPHPSYFRIAFDDDGDDGFIEPASIKPIDPSRPCPYDDDDQCGESDFCNVTSTTGATVLWDNLNPHLSSDARDMTWNVKLPDIECENCTIQVLQIMEDTVHGAYCPQGSCANASASLEDIYHRCIDITLKRDAMNSPGATTEPVNNMGMECNVGAGTAGAGGSAGSAGAAGDSAATAGAGNASAAGASGAAGAAGSTGTSMTGNGGASAAGSTAGAGGRATGAAGATSRGTSAAGGPGTAGSGMGTTVSPQVGAAGSAGTPQASGDSSSSCSVARVGSGESTMAFAWLALGVVGLLVRRRARLLLKLQR